MVGHAEGTVTRTVFRPWLLVGLSGIEATTADVWTRRVGRDWMPYIAAKDDGPGDRSL
jgi:hypothetical protein